MRYPRHQTRGLNHQLRYFEPKTLDGPSQRQPSFIDKESTDDSPRKRRKSNLLSRSFSLDRGKDAYCTTWTRQSFKPSPAPALETDHLVLETCGLVLEEDPPVLETDPESITSLWELVSMSGKLSSLPKATKDSKGQASTPGQSVVTRSSTASKRTSDTTVSDMKLKAPSPYNKDFGKRVLHPRSIIISKLYTVKAHKHFNVEEPTGDRILYYTKKREAAASSVWLRDDISFIEDIIREYSCMHRRNLCEAEFASYARETILKRDRRVLNLLQSDGQRCWRTERMIELVAKPTVETWECPPLVDKEYAKIGDTPMTDYEFDLRPDCAYWLSLQAFDPDYMFQVEEHTFVMNETITCPYLTIEFKKDDSEERVAVNQVAAAAALALYNRFQLRKRSIEISKQRWDQERVEPLKHYGMTFMGYRYSVWCIRVQLTKKFEWNGCHMERVHLGNCLSATGVRDLIDWVNEIHCWGLTMHGPECQNDIKLSMKAHESTSGFRVSDIGPLVSATELHEA